MKKFTKSGRFKRIILAIVIVMSFNFVVPNYSQADFGGALFKPVAQFLATVSDVIIGWMQSAFMRRN